MCLRVGLQSVFLPSQECGPCYVMNMGSVMGIIASDIFLTIFIIICVFCLATRHRRRRECDPKDGEQWLTRRLWSCDESVTDLLVLCLSVSRETTPEGKRNLQTSISKKMAVEVTDSPYQVKVPLWIHIKIGSGSMLIYLKGRYTVLTVSRSCMGSSRTCTVNFSILGNKERGLKNQKHFWNCTWTKDHLAYTKIRTESTAWQVYVHVCVLIVEVILCLWLSVLLCTYMLYSSL